MELQHSTLDVREGDTLIVHSESFFNEKQREQVIQHFKARFPQAKEVVTLEGGLRLTTSRPGSDELLTDIRDTLLRIENGLAVGGDSARQLAEQFDRLTAGGNALLTEPAQ